MHFHCTESSYITTVPVLAFSDTSTPFKVEVDSSDFATKAVLS